MYLLLLLLLLRLLLVLLLLLQLLLLQLILLAVGYCCKFRLDCAWFGVMGYQHIKIEKLKVGH